LVGGRADERVHRYVATFGCFESCGSCFRADLLWFRSQSSNPPVDTAL
jgi:hypothetical protein